MKILKTIEDVVKKSDLVRWFWDTKLKYIRRLRDETTDSEIDETEYPDDSPQQIFD